MDNLELVVEYNKLRFRVFCLIDDHLKSNKGVRLKSIRMMTYLFDDMLGVTVSADDGNIYTFKLTENLTIIETK